MEKKLFRSGCITLDGRMDEPEWELAQTISDFTTIRVDGGGENRPASVDTAFKILPCEDRVYIGIKCQEPDIPHVQKNCLNYGIWNSDAVEVFACPTGDGFSIYQFVIVFTGDSVSIFRSEGGKIEPDRFAPDWKSAVHVGEDYWSVEMEIPLTAFYMTPNNAWNDTWLMNFCRTRGITVDGKYRKICTSSCLNDMRYMEPERFMAISGFPMRPACDDLRISYAGVEINDENEKGYTGTLTVKVTVPEDERFEFTSDYGETKIVDLKAGDNEFTVPCWFDSCKRYQVSLSLKRLRDGKIFKRYYPVRVAYEAIKLQFTRPEYRTNFYPGQDYSKVVGRVISAKPATLHLEGSGIEPQTVTPDAEGNFTFDTSNFQLGEATLTVTAGDKILRKTMRRLAQTERTMTWISGGNLVIDGKPTLARTLYATHYLGGVSFNRRFDADDLHITKNAYGQQGQLQPDGHLRNCGRSVAECLKDAKPSEFMYQHIDDIIESNKDRDFAYYYLSDEPECRNISPVYLKYMYEYLCEKDPYHVVKVASTRSIEYLDIADWLETHPYINAYDRLDGTRVHDRPINSMGNYVEQITQLNRPDKCMGFLPTCFAGNIQKPNPYPSFDEYICHTWAAMIRGGKTLWPYAYHDVNDRACLYEGTRYIFSSFEALEKLVLHGKRTTLTRSLETEAVLYDTGDEKMFVLVNLTFEPQQVTLEGLNGQWHHFRRESKITGNSFTLKPLEVIIGTSEVKDAGLPTYEETAKLIDKLEYERTHRENLLFARHFDIDITGTIGTTITNRIKLFDGSLDNWAWACNQKGEKFMELNLSKVKPTFKTVVLYGSNIADMDIKISVNGQWIAPAVNEVKTEEFVTTFLLKEAVSPDALRFEFHGYDTVELYEIEVF